MTAKDMREKSAGTQSQDSGDITCGSKKAVS